MYFGNQIEAFNGRDQVDVFNFGGQIEVVIWQPGCNLNMDINIFLRREGVEGR